MIPVTLRRDTPVLSGQCTYTGWFLTFLSVAPEERSSLHEVRVGDRGMFMISPEDGTLRGFEAFGVKRDSGEILDSDPPRSKNGLVGVAIPPGSAATDMETYRRIG